MTTADHGTVPPALPDGSEPVWVLTREMIEDRAGRPCTEAELTAVAGYIPFSLITDELDTIVGEACGLYPEVTAAMVFDMAEALASGVSVVLSRDSEDRLRFEPQDAASSAGRDIIAEAAGVAGWPAIEDLDEEACERIAAGLNAAIEDLDASRGGGAVVTAAMVLDLVDTDCAPDMTVISLDEAGELRVEAQEDAFLSNREVITDAKTAARWNDGRPLTEADAGRYAAFLNGQPGARPHQPGPHLAASRSLTEPAVMTGGR